MEESLSCNIYFSTEVTYSFSGLNINLYPHEKEQENLSADNNPESNNSGNKKALLLIT